MRTHLRDHRLEAVDRHRFRPARHRAAKRCDGGRNRHARQRLRAHAGFACRPLQRRIEKRRGDKHHRERQSHEIALAVREPLQLIAGRYDGNVKIVEVPPGPPVMSPIVAEVYGLDYEGQIQQAKQLREVFDATDNIVDVDDSVEYTIRIYDDFENGELCDLMTEKSGFIEHTGFHTIDLDDPVEFQYNCDLFYIYLL